MKKKKILYISYCAPYDKVPHAGGQTLFFYLRNLSNNKAFDVSIISFCNDVEFGVAEDSLNRLKINYALIKHPQIYKIQILTKIINRFNYYNPFSNNGGVISRAYVNKVICTLKNMEIEKPDIVILEWTEMVLLSKMIKSLFPNAKIVASEHDVTFIGYARKEHYYAGLKKLLWKTKSNNEKRAELSALQECDLILPHNKDNISVLVKEGISSNKIQQLTPFYHDYGQERHSEDIILFFGAMGRPENYLSAIWFINNVFPQLDKKYKFVVVGGNPHPDLLSYNSDRIIITGFVDNVSDYFSKAKCFVAPLVLGAGIKVKILEALNTGVPVLTNKIGIEGINATDRKEYFLCETPDDYIQVINSLTEDIEKQIGNNAITFMKDNFSLSKAFIEYEHNLCKLL